MEKTINNRKEFREKLQKGLDKAYEKMLESKRRNCGEIVVIRDDKIVRIKP